MSRIPTNRRERRRPDQLIGLREAADLCGVHYVTLRRWVAAGRINAVRVGPPLLKVSVADVDKLMRPVGGGV